MVFRSRDNNNSTQFSNLNRNSYLFLVSSAAIVYVVTAVTSAALSKKQRKGLRERLCLSKKSHNINSDSKDLNGSYESLIGNTPLVCLHKLSALLSKTNGKEIKIYVKMENLNPGGTGKDRAALSMIRHAQEMGQLPPPMSQVKQSEMMTKGVVIEGTSGSTGISLASLCASKGYECIIFMPDDQAKEKRTILECLGATVNVVPTAAISNPNHYVNLARRKAEEINKLYSNLNSLHTGSNHEQCNKKAVFINQFENLANYHTHYNHTGPEIWEQIQKLSTSKEHGKVGDNKDIQVDAFVMSSGTGGTIAGVGAFLKTKNPNIQVVLVDPPGSSLYNKIKYGVAFAPEQKEQCLRRHRYDTIAEGVGLDRVTKNFAKGVSENNESGPIISNAIQVSDQEMVDMAHWLLREEGLFVGSSSALNVVGAVRTARNLSSGGNVVTVICDGGQRHLTRFWNRDFLTNWGLKWPEDEKEKNGNHKLPQCIEDMNY